MTIHDRIAAVFAEFQKIMHEIAGGAAELAPAAEAIEAVVAPEDVAATQTAAAVASAVAEATEQK